MWQALRAELDDLVSDLARLARRVGQMMTDAATALRQAELPLVESQKLAEQRTPLIVGPVALDIVGRRVIIEGHVVHLPAREAAILEVLMRHAGRVVSPHELCAAISQQHHHHDRVARWVRRLSRRLMINPLLMPLIETVDHAGYRYRPTQCSDHTKP